MAFDGIVTKSIINELQCLIGSKIDKIYEPDSNTIVLSLYLPGNHFSLNICINPQNYRINLTNHSRTNPLNAPNFCMLLRKHLTGGKISKISMQGLERIVQIEIETLNEFNEIEIKTLIIELMGKHSNIILINKDNIIIDAIRRTDTNKNSYRNILSANPYTLPISDKYDFLALKGFDDFCSKISSNNNSDLAKSICDTFTGFSLSFVKDAVDKFEDLNNLYKYFCDVLNNHSSLYFDLIYKNDIPKDYVLKLSNKSSNTSSLNSWIDDYYYEKETTETFVNYRNSILKLILDVLKKYNNRLLNINAKLEECSNMDTYKLYGELITANLYKFKDEHSDSVSLQNYYDNNNLINIPLDKKYTPNDNAKRYFKKYSKLKNAFEIVSEQKKETELELNYIESIVYELDNCSSLEDVENIFEEISENIIFKEKLSKKNQKKNRKSKKKAFPSFSPIEYNIDGYKIYVGRNNKENDKLTLSFANKNDIWFHTKDIHGSHVILKCDKPINNDILVKCAQIAAKHSKAKSSSNVPVDYCLVQYVKKPKNAKPGMVIFTHNKTLNVNPTNR